MDTDNTRTRQNPFFHPLAISIITLSLLQVLIIIPSIFKFQVSRKYAIWIVISAICLPAIKLLLDAISHKFDLKSLKHTDKLLTLSYTLIIIFFYLFLWIVAIISPDLSWDGNAYHIPPISMWTQQGYISWIDTSYLEQIINGYPKGAELIGFLIVKVFGNSVLNGLNLVFLPLGIIGMACISYTLGAKFSTSILSGFLFLFIPININQSITTYVDSAFAACSVSLFAIWLQIITSKVARGIDIYRAIIYGSAIGLVISVKSTGVMIASLSIFTLFIAEIVKNCSAGIRNKDNNIIGNSIRLGLFIVTVLIAAIIVGGYWYIRNYRFTGSFLYPVGLNVFGIQIMPGITISDAINQVQMTPQEIQQFPPVIKILYVWMQSFMKWPLSIRGYDSRQGGLGFLWILGCVPAIIITFVDYYKKGLLKISGYIALFFIVISGFILTPMNWWARYTIWIYALGIPCFVYILDKYLAYPFRYKIMKALVYSWLAGSLLMAMFEGLYCVRDVIALSTPGSINMSISTLINPDSWQWGNNYFFPEIKGSSLDHVISNDRVVAIGPHGNSNFTNYTHLIGQLSQPIGERRLIFIDQGITQTNINEYDLESIIWDMSIPVPVTLIKYPRSEVLGFFVFRLK